MTPREFETSPLVVGAGELWPQAIHADFLSAIEDGDLRREASYLCAWGELNPIGPYAEFIQRWSNPQFVEYVRQLWQLCDGHPHEDQQQYFNEVLRHERDFWKMTWEG